MVDDPPGQGVPRREDQGQPLGPGSDSLLHDPPRRGVPAPLLPLRRVALLGSRELPPRARDHDQRPPLEPGDAEAPLGAGPGASAENLHAGIRILETSLGLDPNYFDALFEMGNMYHLIYDRPETGNTSQLEVPICGPSAASGSPRPAITE